MKNAFGLMVVAMLANLALLLLLSYPAMLLWNSVLVPAISVLSDIGFMQAFGIMLFARLLSDSQVKIESNA